MRVRFFLPAFAISLALPFSSCSKQDEAREEQGSAPVPEENGVSQLAYQESVRAGMDDLKLAMAFDDENGERQQWDGAITLVKDRFATVRHTTSQSKEVHLRRWANVHIAEIPASGEPRANRTEDSPLTEQVLIAERIPSGWKHRFSNNITDGDMLKQLEELDRVEAAVHQFYAGKSLEIGESWQVPASAMARWFGDQVDGHAGDINVRVDRKETLQDHDCVVLAVTVKTSGNMRDPDGQAMAMQLEAEGEIWRAPALQEDLKVDLLGTVELKAAVEARAIEMTLSGPIAIVEERRLRG